MKKLTVLLGLAAVALFAQTDRGNITGSITDASGAAIAGASVIITNSATNQALNTVSTSAGDFNARFGGQSVGVNRFHFAPR